MSVVTEQKIEIGGEVFTENGRRAIYAGEIDGQKFVRVILSREDEEYGTEEWPSDKLTPVSRIFEDEPTETVGPQISKLREEISDLRDEKQRVRASVLDLEKQMQELTAAMAKYPDLATAIDFLEGRITHVAIVPGYGTPEVVSLEEALTQKTDRGRSDGLRLLGLYGTDPSGKVRWNINRYYDGSGGSANWIYPFESEAQAEQFIRERFAEAIEAWRMDGDARPVHRFDKCSVELSRPQDWLDHVKAKKAEQDEKTLAELRAKIAEIEAEQSA